MRINLRPILTNKKKWKHWGLALCFLAPSLAGVAYFVLLPFGDAFRRSFMDTMGDNFVGLSNYKLVIENQPFLNASKNTLRFLFCCIPILLISSFLLTLFIRNLLHYREFFKTVFLLPMAVPSAAMILLWKLFFFEKGLLNGILLFFHQTTIDFMNTDRAFWVLIFTYVWRNMGYSIILWMAGLSSISDSLYEAAQIDGAGEVKQLFYITIPCLRPTIVMITILSAVNSFKVFREAYLIAGSYPHDSIYMLQHIFNNWFQNLDVQKMFAAAVLMTLAVLTGIAVLQRVGGNDEA